MQSTKKLTAVLRDLVALIENEASRNPAFAQSLDDVLTGLPSRASKSSRPTRASKVLPPAPDVFTALQEKGETEFRFWLRSLDLLTLKSVIKVNGFDPGKASQRWTDSDKFVELVADQTIARSKRGAAFLPPKANTEPN